MSLLSSFFGCELCSDVPPATDTATGTSTHANWPVLRAPSDTFDVLVPVQSTLTLAQVSITPENTYRGRMAIVASAPPGTGPAITLCQLFPAAGICHVPLAHAFSANVRLQLIVVAPNGSNTLHHGGKGLQGKKQQSITQQEEGQAAAAPIRPQHGGLRAVVHLTGGYDADSSVLDVDAMHAPTSHGFLGMDDGDFEESDEESDPNDLAADDDDDEEDEEEETGAEGNPHNRRRSARATASRRTASGSNNDKSRSNGNNKRKGAVRQRAKRDTSPREPKRGRRDGAGAGTAASRTTSSGSAIRTPRAAQGRSTAGRSAARTTSSAAPADTRPSSRRSRR